jgi:methylamine dehydrogenase heavy chain
MCIRWRGLAVALAVGCSSGIAFAAEIEPELGSVAVLGKPTPHWFVTLGFITGGSIFDADSGEMQGMISVSSFTSAVSIDERRGQVYVPASYYSRGNYGERTDLLVISELSSLEPIAEVEVPNKLAAVGHRAVINPIGDRHVGLYNMTPAMSVSIVDVEERRFVGEISTAGCAFVYPLAERRFMQLCGDGTVQVITLDRRGAETARIRSAPFFDPETDPVFDLALERAGGWLLVSFEGLAYQVSVGDSIEVSAPWSLIGDEDREERWRVGGSTPLAYNDATGVLLALMHQGGKDTHEDAGTEIWAFDTSTQRRGYRLALEAPVKAISVSADADPRLYVLGEGVVHVHDAKTGRRLRSIEEAGRFASRIQVFGEFQ